MKQKVKPFTLFLCVTILLFIVFGPKFIYRGLKRPSPLDSMMLKQAKWTGIIKIWHVDYVRCGRGSIDSWLQDAIDELESEYLDVFFEIRHMTPERLNMYFQEGIDRDILPDIISLNLYENIIPTDMLEDIGEYLSEKDLDIFIKPARDGIQEDNSIIGIPYMVGWYALMLNSELQEEELYENQYQAKEMDWASLNRFVEETSKENFGFVSYNESYSKPIYCVDVPQINRWTQEGKAPEGVKEMTYSEAWQIFGVQGEAGVFLGPTRAIYDMRARQDRGVGFEMKAIPIPALDNIQLDQVGIYGILRQDNEYKKKICLEFLIELIQDDIQSSLDEIGMFSVRSDIQDIYKDDVDMRRLEEQLNSLYKYEK